MTRRTASKFRAWRKLLTLSLLWYGVLNGICALAPDYGTLLPLRILAVISPAIFTPPRQSWSATPKSK